MFTLNPSVDAAALLETFSRGSTYQKMGMIPIASNIKGAIETAGGLAILAASTVTLVALSALYFVSRAFSADKCSIFQLCQILKDRRPDKLSFAEKLKVFAITTAGIGVFGLNIIYHGLQQQIPIVGNFCYALDLGKSLKKA